MAQRKQVTILYSYDEGWIGGTYYIQSLIQCLSLLPHHQQPNLIILCTSETEFKQIENTGYPYLKKWARKNVIKISAALYFAEIDNPAAMPAST